MKQFFNAIPLTFYSKSFYVDLIRRGEGIGMGFILLRVILLMLVPTFTIIPLLPSGQQHVEDIFNRFPEVTMKSNKLSIDKSSPYIVNVQESQKNSPSIVFDTTPREKNLTDIARDMKAQNMLMLITSDFLAVPKNSSVEVYSYSETSGIANKDVVIDHAEWVSFGKRLLLWGAPIIFIMAFAASFVGSLIAAFIKALAVKILSLFLTIKPTIPGAMRLSAAAAIPPAVLALLAAAVGHPIPFLIGFLIWGAYALFGLISANDEAKATVH